MADHDSRERWLNIAEAVLTAFWYIREMLEDLPIPVTVPDFDPIADDAPEVLISLNRARTIIADEPISDRSKRAHDRLILDWFAAYEMVAIVKVAGPAPWRLDTAEYALVRLAATGDLIESGEIDELDDES